MSDFQDDRFANMALERQFVSAEQAAEAKQAQAQAAEAGQQKPLADVMVEKGLLTAAQADSLREALSAAGPGKIGEFEIISKLGEGGMGAVYKARQTSMDRMVALKLLPGTLARNPELVARFRREAQVSAKLDHPNVIRGIAVGEEAGQHFFAMELVEGTSVENMLEEQEQLDIPVSLDIITQITRALIHAHERGMIHRDIKPDNIMVTHDGVAKLADLGLVREADTQMTRVTQSGATMGTPHYMPPEQARDAKRADERSDIYALGATFYHMLTGRVPFEGDSAFEIMQKHEKERAKSPRSIRADIPAKLSLAVEKMMQRDPRNRFASAEELLSMLQDVSGKAPAAAAAKPAKAPAPPKPGDKYWHVRFKGSDGQEHRHRAQIEVLRTAIAAGQVPRTAMAQKGEGPWKPLHEYPELVQAPTQIERQRRTATPSAAPAKARGKAPAAARPGRAGKQSRLASFYTDMEEEARRRKQMKLVKKVVKIVVIVLVVAVAGVLVYTHLDQIKELINKLLKK